MTKFVLVGLFSGVAFLAIYLIGGVFWIALGGAAVIGVSSSFLIPEKQTPSANLDYAQGYTPEKDLASGRVYLENFKGYLAQISKDPAAENIGKIISNCEKIFESIEKDNIGFDTLRDLTGTFLPALNKVLDQYAETIKYNLSGKMAQDFIRDTRDFLENTAARFKIMLQNVHQEDIFNATIEKETLRILMNLDSLDIVGEATREKGDDVSEK